jgi:carbonic anhydrase/acetyltransferase-like protein (isoleucine patch superfamily)
MMYEYRGIKPKLGLGVFLAPGVIVIGDVEIGDYSNLWFYTVARGDVNSIRIGRGTNIQDHCMLHVTSERFPLHMGDDVIVGHRAVLHGCTVRDGVLIGVGALVLDGAVVEEGAIVAAGAVVAPGTVIPANTVALGVPARPTREPTEDEKRSHKMNASKYEQYARDFHRLVQPVWSSAETP